MSQDIGDTMPQDIGNIESDEPTPETPTQK